MLNEEYEIKKKKFLFEHFGGVDSKVKKTIVCLHNKAYAEKINNNKNISAVITTKELSTYVDKNKELIIDDDPVSLFYSEYIIYVNDNKNKKPSSNISDKALISNKAIISSDNVIIEDDVIIEDNVIIKNNVTIKKGSIIRAGAVIGGEGFGVKTIYGNPTLIPHSGNVIIEDNVEIQYNTCIDSGLFETDTIIGSGTKIDNLCHIAHGVQMGRNCLVAAKAMIAGSCVIGNNVWVGPNSAISDFLIIGDNAKISLGSMVTRNVEKDQMVTGYFAQDHKLFLKKYLAIFK